MIRSKIAFAAVVMLVVAGVIAGTGFLAPAAATAGAPQSALSQAVKVLFAPAAVQASTQPAAPKAAVAAATAAPATTISIQAGADAESQVLEAIYQKVNPSVVEVVNLAQQSSGRFRGQSSSGGPVPQGEGSGFVWDTQGHIVTNDHVVSGADKLQVVFADGTQVDATLVGTDPNGDIAVVKVDPSLVSNLVPVEVGDMSQVKVGQMVAAIGNPFGFTGTMTRGIVSALGRSIPSQTTYSIPQAIQTDAAINPGNSGGPLLNDTGQVIGVNDQIQSASGSNSGVGFAIPISIVSRIVPSLISSGSYQHAYLGISGNTFSPAWAQTLGLPASARGAYVAAVASNSPAAKAGLRGGSQDTSIVLGSDNTGTTYLQSGGDLITAVDGQTITKMDDLLMYMEEHSSPGQTIKLTVMRSGGQQTTLSVTLASRPTQTVSFNATGNGQSSS